MGDEPNRPPAAVQAEYPADAPDPVASGAEAVQVVLPEFEGPLDLLLHLIKKEELEIVNIPIALITEKYLAYLQLMQALNLDVAGEYLLMAATLAYLKSRELVPPDPTEVVAGDPDGDEDELGDPRQELIRRLLEYQKYKEAARQLGDRPVVGRNVFLRGARAEDVARLAPESGSGLEEVPVFRLIEALEKVLARARIHLTHDVVVERMTITDKINELVDRLDRDVRFTFADCFAFLDEEGIARSVADLRHLVVITFLALLEMTRLKMIRLHQAADRGEIYISRKEPAADPPP